MPKRKMCRNMNLMLPNILKIIFQFNCSSFNDRLQLQLVCKEWKYLCDDRTLISSLKLFFEPSKFFITDQLLFFLNSAVRVELVCGNHNDELIICHLHKCQYLTLSGLVYSTIIAKCKDMPCLEEFVFEGYLNLVNISDFIGGNYPQVTDGWLHLKTLILKEKGPNQILLGCILHLFSGALNLQHLSLFGYLIIYFNSQDLFHIHLRRLCFPNLVSLFYDNKYFCSDELPNLVKQFPKLKYVQTLFKLCQTSNS